MKNIISLFKAQITFYNPITGGFWTIVEAVLDVVKVLIRTFFVTIVIYAGIVMMSSAGDPEKFAQGKKIIFKAIIALAIAESAQAIIALLITAFT